MASTVTLTGDWMQSLGNRRATSGTLNLGNPYAADGIAVTAAQVGLGVIEDLQVMPCGGYTFEYVKSSGKVKAYRAGNDVPDVVVTGGQGAGTALQMTPDTAAGVLGKTAATTRTIPGATFGLTAKPAALAEAGAIDLHLIEARFFAIGW